MSPNPRRIRAATPVIARVTGAYDKISLPDPLELRFYFTLADAISQLVIIPLKRG
jgi:hypothetical protein